MTGIPDELADQLIAPAMDAIMSIMELDSVDAVDALNRGVQAYGFIRQQQEQGVQFYVLLPGSRTPMQMLFADVPIAEEDDSDDD